MWTVHALHLTGASCSGTCWVMLLENHLTCTSHTSFPCYVHWELVWTKQKAVAWRGRATSSLKDTWDWHMGIWESGLGLEAEAGRKRGAGIEVSR